MKKIMLSFLVLLFFNCKEQTKNTTVSEKKSKLSLVKKHASLSPLENSSNIEIVDWKEYQSLKKFLTRFENISPNEALSNALELKDLVKKVKDSIKPEILKNSAFKARINVLENESLRLADMTYIPAIKAKEVNLQVAKIISLYESMNEKIDIVYTKKQFEEGTTINDSIIKRDTLLRQSRNKLAPPIPIEKKQEIK